MHIGTNLHSNYCFLLYHCVRLIVFSHFNCMVSYTGPNFIKLLDWIPIEKLDLMWLPTTPNPNAIHILEKTWVKFIGIICLLIQRL